MWFSFCVLNFSIPYREQMQLTGNQTLPEKGAAPSKDGKFISSTEEKFDNCEFNICTEGTAKPYPQQSESENSLGGGCIYLQLIPGSKLLK